MTNRTKANIEKNLIKSIRKQRSSFIGHKTKRGGLENIVNNMKDKWQEKQAKTKTKNHGHVNAVAKQKDLELMETIKDRDLWRTVTHQDEL